MKCMELLSLYMHTHINAQNAKISSQHPNLTCNIIKVSDLNLGKKEGSP